MESLPFTTLLALLVAGSIVGVWLRRHRS